MVGTALGTPLGAAVGTSFDPDFTPKSVPHLFSWHRADTLSATPVSSWSDKSGNAHTIAQGTAGLRPTWSASDAHFHSRASVTADGIDDRLDSSEAASTWKFIHNGGAFGVYVAWRNKRSATPQTIVGTCGGDSLETGFRIGVSFGGLLIAYICNGSGTYFAAASQGSPAADPNVTTISALRYAGSGSVKLYGLGVGEASFATSGSASASDPTITLRVFNDSQGNVCQADLAEIITYNAYPSDSSHNALIAYMRARYGV